MANAAQRHNDAMLEHEAQQYRQLLEQRESLEKDRAAALAAAAREKRELLDDAAAQHAAALDATHAEMVQHASRADEHARELEEVQSELSEMEGLATTVAQVDDALQATQSELQRTEAAMADAVAHHEGVLARHEEEHAAELLHKEKLLNEVRDTQMQRAEGVFNDAISVAQVSGPQARDRPRRARPSLAACCD